MPTLFILPALLLKITQVHCFDVLFISIDDLRWMDSAKGTHGDLATPGFDELAAEALVLTNSHVQMAVCTASRGSILTGRRIDTVRLYKYAESKYVDGGGCTSCLTIPELFRAEGYWTGGTGKVFHDFWQNGGHASAWNEYDNMNSGEVRLDDTMANAVDEVASGATLDTKILATAQTRIKELSKEEQSWFYAVGFRKPHLPWVAPQEFFDRHPLEKISLPVTYKTCPGPDVPRFGAVEATELTKFSDVIATGYTHTSKRLCSNETTLDEALALEAIQVSLKDIL